VLRELDISDGEDGTAVLMVSHIGGKWTVFFRGMQYLTYC
jgi:hypothetical protein